MATLRLFAQVREAAGAGSVQIEGDTVAQVIEAAESRFGSGFAALVPTCRVWLNGEPADPADPVGSGDEVALLPPVSGG